MGIKINELFIYRWRYWIGYGVVSLGLAAVLFFVGMYSPGGISYQEVQSIIKSGSIDFSNLNTLAVTNLPYHLLQLGFISVFGVSTISIKLASIVLALVAAIGIILLLKRWFGPGVGVLASLIAITTSQFLFISQDGTPGILYLVWPVWLLLLASLIARNSHRRTLYKIGFFIVAALSLYTPLSLYVLLALLGAIILHPHLRYLIGQLSQAKLLVGFIIGVVLLVPLGALVFKDFSLGLSLLGIPDTVPNISNNLSLLSSQYFSFTEPGQSVLPTPFFGLGSMLIIILGLADIIRNRSNAKSYVIISWLVFLLPIVLLNPNSVSITFLPLVLLLTSGIRAILVYWYGLFPKNPYARVAGLIPIVVLVFVLISSGVDRNIYGYRYDPTIAPKYSRDLSLLPNDTSNLVVSSAEVPFYEIVARYNHQMIVSTLPSNNNFTATHDARGDYQGYEIIQIITTTSVDNSDRFYVYQKIKQ